MNLHILRAERRLTDWSSLSALLSSRLLQTAAPAIALFGYLILFNDTIVEHLSFVSLTGAETAILPLKAKLQITYFGLIFITISAVWFRYRCPEAQMISATQSGYRQRYLEAASISDLLQMYLRLEKDHSIGLFDDSKFDREGLLKLIEDATPSMTSLESMTDEELWYATNHVVSGRDTIERNAEFVYWLLDVNFDIDRLGRKQEAYSVGALSLIGILLLTIPSFELFFRVCIDLFR